MSHPRNGIDLDTEQQIAARQTAVSETCNGASLWRALKLYRASLQSYTTGWNLRSHIAQDSDDLLTWLTAGLEQSSVTSTGLLERAGQCCFLCLSKHGKQIAISVPCLRPTQPRIAARRLISKLDGTKKNIYHAVTLTEKAVESDADIFKRLQSTSFEHSGKWKSWLPFYGITHVEEVLFQFVGVVDRDDTMPVRMTPFDLTDVREEVKEVLAMEPTIFDFENGGLCDGKGYHSEQCTDMMEYQSKPCMLHQIAMARSRQRKMQMRDQLTVCAQNPQEANGIRSLEGMVGESPIYEKHGRNRVITPVRNEPYDNGDKLRGLHFTLGWQKDRLYRELPRNALWLYMALMIIWLCVFGWSRPSGDWSNALAFGQLVAACIALIAFYA